MGAGTAPFNAAATWAAYLDTVQGVFLPQAESNMSRLEFEGRRQAASEPISVYLTKKMALFRSFNPEAIQAQTWSYFRRETLSGVYSKTVMQKMIERSLANFEEMQTMALDVVSNIREAYALGAQNVANMDGLASTTTFAQSRYEEAMDINSISDKNCERCHKAGHKAATCWERMSKADFAKRGNSGSGGGGGGGKDDDKKKRKGNCNHCHKAGHWKRECQQFLRDKKNGVLKKTDPKKTDKAKNSVKNIEGEEKCEAEEKEEFGDDASLNAMHTVEDFRHVRRSGHEPKTWMRYRRK